MRAHKGAPVVSWAAPYIAVAVYAVVVLVATFVLVDAGAMWFRVTGAVLFVLALWLFYMADLYPRTGRDRPGKRAKPQPFFLAIASVLLAGMFL